jgi:predicted ATP-grasp superfamily ATP-dependent carboligase
MLRPEVIVLDANQRSSLAVTRSLGRTGLAITVADCMPNPLASASRYAKSTLLYPSPVREMRDFDRWIRALPASHPGAVLVPTTDATVSRCLAARDVLGDLKLPFPSLAAYQEVSDKFGLFERCGKLGVDVPHTALMMPDGDAVAAWQGRYPVVVKPRWSAVPVPGRVLRQSVSYASTPSELATIVRHLFSEGAPALLLQEYIEGEGRGVFGLYDQGRRVTAFAHRRIREKPPSGGVSVCSESVALEPQLVDWMDRLVGPLNWHGVAMAEFKMTPEGRAVLIEINGRFWGSLQLAIDAGVDFPKYLYDLAIGSKIVAPPRYAVGRRLRWLLGDLDHTYLVLKDRSGSVGACRKIRAALRALTPWLPKTRTETFRLSDPMPFVAELRQYFGSG